MADEDMGKVIPIVKPVPVSALQSDLAAILERAEATLREREELPCAGFTAEKDARNACQNAQARSCCAFRSFSDTCPWERLSARSRAAEEACSASGVPAREHALIVAHVWERTKLADTEPIRVMRAILTGAKCRVDLAPGRSVLIPAHPAITILGGPRGIGKTVAACLWLARAGGGLYRTAYALGDCNADLTPWIETPRLVIDQLGREHSGVGSFALTRFEGVLDARYANKRPTVVCANGKRAEVVERYGGVIEARLEGDGVFADVAGPDLRKGGKP